MSTDDQRNIQFLLDTFDDRKDEDKYINEHKDDFYYIHSANTLENKLKCISEGFLMFLRQSNHYQIVISQIYDAMMGGAALAIGSFSAEINYHNGDVLTLSEYVRCKSKDKSILKSAEKRRARLDKRKEQNDIQRNEQIARDIVWNKIRADGRTSRENNNRFNNLENQPGYDNRIEERIVEKEPHHNKKYATQKSTCSDCKVTIEAERESVEIDTFLDDLIQKNLTLPSGQRIKMTYATVCRITEISLKFNKLKQAIHEGKHPMHFPSMELSYRNADSSIRNFHVGAFQSTVDKIGKLKLSWTDESKGVIDKG